jgi:fructose-bisphosphate aldolase class II
MGAKLIQLMFGEMARGLPIPAALHLDHCADRAVIGECLQAGWSSVLFDASQLPYEENPTQTKEVVAHARLYGAAVEGELEAVKGVEDGFGSDGEVPVVPLDLALAFMRATGIDSFAPAIGTAHGFYQSEPKINFDRVSEIVAALPLPLVVHGGTGLSDSVIQELIRRGAVKINLSTQLKVTLVNGLRAVLNEHPDEHEPLKLLGAVEKTVQSMAAGFMRVVGSEGKAA